MGATTAVATMAIRSSAIRAEIAAGIVDGDAANGGDAAVPESESEGISI
jgi:hypothetical protein